MGAKPNNNASTRFLQILGILVGVISLGWGVYSQMQKKYQKEMDAATILRLTERVFNLQSQNAVHEENIKTYKVREDSLMVVQKNDRDISLKHKGIADAYRLQVEQLQTKLNEKVIINATDDEHIRMFIGWAKQPTAAPDAH